MRQSKYETIIVLNVFLLLPLRQGEREREHVCCLMAVLFYINAFASLKLPSSAVWPFGPTPPAAPAVMLQPRVSPRIFKKMFWGFDSFDTVNQYKTFICTQNGLQFMTNINAIEHLCCVTLHMLRHKNAFKQKHLKHTCSSPRLSESLQR